MGRGAAGEEGGGRSSGCGCSKLCHPLHRPKRRLGTGARRCGGRKAAAAGVPSSAAPSTAPSADGARRCGRRKAAATGVPISTAPSANGARWEESCGITGRPAAPRRMVEAAGCNEEDNKGTAGGGTRRGGRWRRRVAASWGGREECAEEDGGASGRAADYGDEASLILPARVAPPPHPPAHSSSLVFAGKHDSSSAAIAVVPVASGSMPRRAPVPATPEGRRERESWSTP